MAFLEVRGLEVGPPSEPRVRGLEFELEVGQVGLILGRSGSGKSQLLRGLAGLEPARWQRAELRGASIGSMVPAARRHSLLYVHAQPVRTAGTVEDNLRRVRALGRTTPVSFEDACAWLQRLHLPDDILGRSMVSLSLGEASRVALVRALQLSPVALLLDEPTAALDAASLAAVEALLREWVGGDTGRALLCALHDTELAARLGDRFLVLEGGVPRYGGADLESALAALPAVPVVPEGGAS